MKNTKTQALRLAAQQGFSLVELMVVVTIIGILAGIAVPKFQTFKARANQTEAKSGLQGLYLSIQAFEANYNELPNVAAVIDPAVGNTAQGAPIGFSLTGAKQKYLYRFLSGAVASTDGWSATASSIDLLKGSTGTATVDVMRINTNKWICNPWDAVTGVAAVAAVGATASSAATGARECPQVAAAATTRNTATVPVMNASGYDAP